MEQPKEKRLPELSGGLNTNDPEYSIFDSQSPDLLNMWYKDMALCKRPGQSLVTELDDVYKVSDPFNDYRVVHAGTNLYKWKDGTATAITTDALEDGIEDAAGVFVEFGDILYYMDGVEIWQITSSFVVSAVTPYAPVVMINVAPDLSSSDDNESYNLIGAGFKVWFNGDAASTTYSLPQTALDATAVTVSINGTAKTENTHFTVNRTLGTIDFSAGTSPHGAPADGTNNVVVTAYKTVSDDKDRIVKCTIGIPFGGESSGVTGGTRVFVMGNPDHPYYYWKSDLGLHVSYGMTYFPDTFEEVLDQNSEAITAAAKMGELLIVFKKESVFGIGYEYDGEEPYYPVTQLHDSIGCDMPGSVQLIDNKLVFGKSTEGIYILTSYNNASESIIKPLSANINKLLLKEADLDEACSCDYDQYYMLCVNGYVYLWDYGKTPYRNYSDYDEAQRRLAWYRWNGINAAQFFQEDGELYHGCATGIVKFQSSQNDFGEGYTAYFKTKAFDLGLPNYEKTFLEIYPSFSSDGNILATVTIENEDGDSKSHEYDIKSFDLGSFNLEAFTLARIKFADTYRFRAKLKKSIYIQIIVSGDEENRGVGLSGLRFTFTVTREVKKRG